MGSNSLNIIPGSYLCYRLLAWLISFSILGYIFNAITSSLLIGTSLLLIWHYKQLFKLSNWLWKTKKLSPPQAKGSWEAIFNGIYRLQNKSRKKNQQLIDLLVQFRKGAEALPDAAVVLDAQSNIVWCNKLAQLTLGLVWPQDSGQKIDNLLRHPEFIHYLYRTDHLTPLEILSPVNDATTLEIRLMKYGDKQLLLIARDITRIRQLEVMRKDFVANVSHELKTPLTVLQGYLEVMAAENTAELSAKPLALMQQQTKRMQTMVEQLLVLSRIEDTEEINLESSINMDLIIKEVADNAYVLSNSQHHLSFDIETGIHLYGNELQVKSACANLVENAIRYTKSGGVISVSLKQNSHGMIFSVTDSGVGIDRQHIPRLTERFYRVDSSRSSKTGGSGLGLAIVKHALNHHNAELTISSKLGNGSNFSFIIPSQFIKG